MTGLNKYDRKERRKMRRLNHIAKDLRSPKYKYKVIPDKKKNQRWEDYEDVDID